MKNRLLALALICSLGLAVDASAQAPKTADKAGDKKAPAPKTPADLAFDEFNKARTEPGAKDQARFQKVVNAGLAYLTQHSTHGRVNDAVRDLAFFPGGIDKKQPALKTSYLSLLKLEVTNQRYKDGVTDPAKAALAAVDAAIADFEVREAPTKDAVANFREKIDALTETPGSGRFISERERSYTHVLALSFPPPRAEEHLKKLLEHKEKGVKDMARAELNFFETKKEPFALKFTALDGKEVDFAQLRGKVVGLYVWSSKNKGSTDRIEQLRMIHSDYRKRGFEMVTVSYDKEEDRETLTKYIKENRVAWPVGFDGKGAKNDFASKLNATAPGRLYIFDQKGMLQTTLQGAPVAAITPDIPNNQVEGMVKRLLGVK